MTWEFPGSSVVQTQRFHCWGLNSIPRPGTKIPPSHMVQDVYIYVSVLKYYFVDTRKFIVNTVTGGYYF